VPVLQYLVAAGVGRVGIVEMDRVELSNLHRQVLYTTQDVGQPKALVAKERLSALNPLVEIEAYPVRLTSEKRPGDPEGLRPGGGRLRQLPHPLPDKRRLRAF
jgi:molybdopterin/thiamine biosynthesis adenylyltransferase